MNDNELTENLAEKLRGHLHAFYEASERTPEQIARGAQTSEAALQEVLAKSDTELTLTDVFMVLGGLDVPPHRFFGDLFDSPSTTVETRLLALEEELLGLGVLNREGLDGQFSKCRFRDFA